VRVDGQRASLLTILKTGSTSTLDIISQVKAKLPIIKEQAPPALQIKPTADQSIFVRAAIDGVAREALIAACLTAAMILIFLGSWRSTLIIAVSIPLAVICSLLVLAALGQTINIMTLGGLALAVGILVDDATVTIENIDRNLEEGKEVERAILDGAAQIAVPAFVSTLAICIVFVPMFFLSGVAKYLFVPLAEAVVFAMLASYFLSRTIVPTMAKYLLRGHEHDREEQSRTNRNPFVWVQTKFERSFERLRVWYRGVLALCLARRGIFLTGMVVFWVASLVVLYPWLGQDFFPTVDGGQFKLHVRAHTGTRIEDTARLCDDIERVIRQEIPPSQLATIIDNIGVPYSGLNLSYTNSAPVGTGDADILVSLNEKHRPTEEYMRALRDKLTTQFPGTEFYYLPTDIVSQILNFGLPAPIDVQISGLQVEQNRELALKMMQQISRIPGATDLRLQQPFDQPKFTVNVDRTRAQEVGYTQSDVARTLLTSLSGSFQTNPTFYLNPQNHVSYSIAVQTPQYDIKNLQELENVPLTGANKTPQILGNVASFQRGAEPGTVSHYDAQPIVDVYGAVDGTDLVGNLKLDAGSKVGTVTNIQVHIRLVHPTDCLKVYNFVTDQDFNLGILDSTSLNVPKNGAKAGKVTSSQPGQFSDNVLVVNTCGSDQSFDLRIGLDSSFTTNGANAVKTYNAAGEFDSSNFNTILSGTGTPKGQSLCLQNVTVAAGTSFLATAHSKITDNWPQTSLPADGTFDFAASLYEQVNASCSGSLHSLASPNPAAFVLPFTIK